MDRLHEEAELIELGTASIETQGDGAPAPELGGLENPPGITD